MCTLVSISLTHRLTALLRGHGTRNMKSVTTRLLELTARLRQLEAEGDFTARLALLEEQKCHGKLFGMNTERNNVPVGEKWLDEVKQYEKSTLLTR